MSARPKKVAIVQSNYIPWRGYFDLINSVDEFVLFDDVQYTKRDWRNRNQIKTRQGPIWLTIPVEVKGKYLQKIREVRLVDQLWAKDHLLSILHHYSGAPYLAQYRNEIEHWYQEAAQLEFLSQINHLFLTKICAVVGITTRLRWSSEFELHEEKNRRLLLLCKQVNADIYVSGPAARDYLQTDMFAKEGMQVEWFDYSSYKEYPQLFPPFINNLSMLDLLLNTGPNASSHMSSFPRDATLMQPHVGSSTT